MDINIDVDLENIPIPPTAGAPTQNTHETLPLRSPGSWSYDAPTRCLNKRSDSGFYKNPVGAMSSSCISILTECAFTPQSSRDYYSEDYDESHASEIDIANCDPQKKPKESNAGATTKTKDAKFRRKSSTNKSTDILTKTQFMAALLLLTTSGILDAGAIAYATWLFEVGFSVYEMVMYQGIVELIVCFAFAVIAVILSSNVSSPYSHHQNMTKKVSLAALIFPFSPQYNQQFVRLFKRKKKQTHRILNGTHTEQGEYGTMSDAKSPKNGTKRTKKLRPLSLLTVISTIFVFGVIGIASHLTYLMGYVQALNANHFEIAPLFGSLVIGLTFLWSFLIYRQPCNEERLMSLFLLYVGMLICGYSFVRHSNLGVVPLLLTMSNAYLIVSACMDSLAYVWIRYASNVPTLILVFAESLFCALLGPVLLAISHETINSMTFIQVIEMSSVGLIGFCSTWCFVRGTQLISMGVASFMKICVLTIFSIVIQVFTIDGTVAHFYCIVGICLIGISLAAILYEKYHGLCKQ